MSSCRRGLHLKSGPGDCLECRREYQRQYRRANPARQRAYRLAYENRLRTRDSMIWPLTKTCAGCGEEKEAAAFGRVKTRRSLLALCGRCRGLARHGLSHDDFVALLHRQGGACAVCRTSFGDKVPHVDHDHGCCPGTHGCRDCVRGLLCARCNQGLGLLRDNGVVLSVAANYVGRRRRRCIDLSRGPKVVVT